MPKKSSTRERAALTRRRFLEQLGVIGGSSLVMSAMQSLDLMAGQAGERPVLSGRPARAKVLVLGAGVSGLVVGYELGKLGYDFQILEARERVGGLNWTVRKGTEHTEIDGGERQVCTFDEGQYVNVGPWRIPYTHTGVLNYCKELNVPLQIFMNEAEGSYFFYEGNAAGSLSNKRVRLREVKADMIGHVNELLVKAVNKHQLDVALTADDQEKLVRFLVSQGYLDASDRTYKAFTNRGPGNPYDFAALIQSGFWQRMRSVPPTEGTAAAPMFQPVGGMDQFPKGLQRGIGPNRITFNAEVQSVHQSDSAKMGLQMKRRFWEEDDQIFGGHLYSNLPLGEFSYPSYDYWTKKGVLLGLYANGPVGDLIDQPIKGRIEHVLTHASKVHPQIRQEFESAYAVFWKKVKYNLGGYASGRGNTRRDQLSKVENRIVIGSAVTAPFSEPDWQEGAVAAGWQALKSVHARAMQGA